MSYLEKVKSVELNILKYIAKICDENNIRYYLIYGTLLGAVRHEGFIPWDDDIDIVMPRKDYERFRQLIDSDKNEDYELVSWYKNGDYPFIFPKVIYTKSELKEKSLEHIDFKYGIYVDIFVMDGLPENKTVRVIMERWHKFRYHLIRYYYSSKSNLPSILRSIQPIYQKMINVKKVQKRIDDMYLKYDFDNSKECRVQLGFTPKAYLKTDYFEQGKMLNFEGELFRCPKKTNECLKAEYGDYMQLPKEEDRVSNHTFSKLKIDNESFEVKN